MKYNLINCQNHRFFCIFLRSFVFSVEEKCKWLCLKELQRYVCSLLFEDFLMKSFLPSLLFCRLHGPYLSFSPVFLFPISMHWLFLLTTIFSHTPWPSIVLSWQVFLNTHNFKSTVSSFYVSLCFEHVVLYISLIWLVPFSSLNFVNFNILSSPIS